MYNNQRWHRANRPARAAFSLPKPAISGSPRKSSGFSPAQCQSRRMPPTRGISLAARLISIWFAFAALCGCTVQLAPAYDQSVYDGLVAANKHLQALFVAAGGGVTQATYPARATLYDHLIAELMAVELQIKARPIPNADALAKTDQLLTKLGVAGLPVDHHAVSAIQASRLSVVIRCAECEKAR